MKKRQSDPREKSAQSEMFRESLTGLETKSLRREIMILAAPVFIGQGINALVSFVSRVIISELGNKAFNAVNIGMMIFFLIMVMLTAISVGTTTLVAQNWGSNNKERVNEILQQSLVFGFFLSIFIGVLGLVTRQMIFDLLGTDPETARIGSEFLFWMFVGIPLFTPGFFLASALRGVGDTKSPMFAGIIMSVATLFLSYGLILGKFGFPRLEAAGAALAIDISFTIFTLILVGAIFRKNSDIQLLAHGWKPDLKTGISIFKIGIPSATEWFLIQVGILTYISVVSKYGDEILAAFFAGLAVLNLAQAISQGFQIATTTLVGQKIGAKNIALAESVFRQSAFLSFSLMGGLGLLFMAGLNTTVLSFLFSELSPVSIQYAHIFIIILAFAMPLMGVSFSVAGGLRGAGDTILPLISSVVGVFGGRVLFALLIYHLFHPPVYIIWCSMYPDLIIRTLTTAIAFKSGRWKRLKIDL